MIPIDNNKAYDVLQDGDNVQVIHECDKSVLIGFIDPASGNDVLAWVDNEYVSIHGKPEKDVARNVKGVHIRLAYSKEHGIISETPKKERKTWIILRPLQSRYLRAALLLVVAWLVLTL